MMVELYESHVDLDISGSKENVMLIFSVRVNKSDPYIEIQH